MKNKISTKKSQKAWEEAKKIIPGGNQLLSKRGEMSLPGKWPAYFTNAKGVTITDIDGNTFIDMTHMSVGASTLGYADPDVNKAVKKVIDAGSISTLNPPEELELAKLLLEIHPWAGMVRYARTGGEAMMIAVRISRAFSGKDKIAFCGYHGWHDWYLSTNLSSDKNLDGHHLSGLNPLGVPRALVNSAIPFHYNKIEELEKIVESDDVGVIIMETIRHQEPQNGFLEKVRKIATDKKIVLIFDEISAGFRLCIGGAHLKYGVNPDVAVFSKSISNGFPMAAVIGRKEIMNMAQDTFISSSYWSERIGPTAAIATIKKMKKAKMPQHLEKIGKMIEGGWISLSKKHELDISTIGPYSLVTFSFNYKNALELKTLFSQEMLKRGFLASLSVYVSLCHTEAHINKYLRAVDEVFCIISKGIKSGSVQGLLEGPIAHSGFARLT